MSASSNHGTVQTDRPDDRPESWHARTARDVLEALASDPQRGLTLKEARRRRTRYGPNVLKTIGRPPWTEVLLRQFTDVLILVLLAAAALSLVVGELGDAVTILAIVLLNGLLGFAQEWKAERALDALRRMLSPQCRVIRNGVEKVIDSRRLVPGDLVRLEIGDRVPADLRLLEAVNLKADESALTGESASVEKSLAVCPAESPIAARGNIAWMGATISNGRALGIVVATGMATEFGRIARLTQSVEGDITPLQRKLGILGKQLGVVACLLSLLVVTTGWALGRPLTEMLLTGVSLAVALVPEGLPAVVTITLAMGIGAMVRRRALLRRLQATEALGAASVICTDKTGTLTQNEMTVTRIWLPAGALQVTGVGYDPAGHFEVEGRKLDYRTRPDLLGLLEAGLICNHAQVSKDETGWQKLGEPTEAALVVAAYKAWLSRDDEAVSMSEFSFNSRRKRMTVITHGPDETVAYCKGAPEVVMARCTRLQDGDSIRLLTDQDRKQAEQAYSAMAMKGLRTLAIARRPLLSPVSLDEDAIERDLTLLGIVGIIDPPRPEVPDAIRVAEQAGIKVILITGDAGATAQAIADRIGLRVRRTVTGQEVAALDDQELTALLRDDVLFARTSPEDKMRIVDLLQSDGQVVGMTGDGVNDAPALMEADIGIAMGLRGTDVAKGAADMILTDDNFASIIGAIEEGRRQYANIKKFVAYLLSSNTGEVVAIFCNILLGGPLILLPVQILWINLVTDGLTALALGVEPREPGVMKDPPRRVDERLIDRTSLLLTASLGCYIGLAALFLFYRGLETGGGQGVAYAQTLAFTAIIVLEKVSVFNFRALREPLAVVGFLTNPWLLLAVAGTLGLQILAVYVPLLQSALHTVPLALEDWGLILLTAAPIFLVTESVKIYLHRFSRR